MPDPVRIGEALEDLGEQLLKLQPGMLVALRGGSRGDTSPLADQPTLFEVRSDDPRRFIEPPSRLAKP